MPEVKNITTTQEVPDINSKEFADLIISLASDHGVDGVTYLKSLINVINVAHETYPDRENRDKLIIALMGELYPPKAKAVTA